MLTQEQFKKKYFKELLEKINDTKLRVYTTLEKPKETVLEFYKGTAKVLWENINGWIQ